MDELDLLKRLCPPLVTPRTDTWRGNGPQRWAIPKDYAQLLESYGPGCFDDFLWIYGEGASNVHMDLRVNSEAMREIVQGKQNPGLHELLRSNAVAATDLIQWAGTDNADSFFWLTAGPPEQWKTLAVEAGFLTFTALPLHATSVIVNLLNGTLRLDFMPDDFPSPGAQFSPGTASAGTPTPGGCGSCDGQR